MMYIGVWWACILSDTSNANLNFIPYNHVSSYEDNDMYPVDFFGEEHYTMHLKYLA